MTGQADELDALLGQVGPERAEELVRAHAQQTLADLLLERGMRDALAEIRRTGNLSATVDILGRALHRAELASIEPTLTEGSTTA